MYYVIFKVYNIVLQPDDCGRWKVKDLIPSLPTILYYSKCTIV